MNFPKLRGNTDLIYILSIALVVAIITGFLLQHLHTRHELFSAARERSMAAYHVRQLKEQERHLHLEERIREAKIGRDDAPEEDVHAPADRTVLLSLPGRNLIAPHRGKENDRHNDDAHNDDGDGR